jgi:alcohol dehydrogenase class IV
VGAHYGVPHGIANAIHLPHVIRFNSAGGSDVADRFRNLNELLGLETGGSDEEVGETLAGYVSELVARLGLPTRLSQVGVPEQGIPTLVEGAVGDAASLLNPREVGEEDYAGLYRRAL